MNKGFSLLEVVVAIALMAIAAAVVIPRITQKKTKIKKEFFGHLNNLMSIAQANAVATGQTHRIFFDFKNKNFRIELLEKKDNEQDEDNFIPLEISYVKTFYPIDEKLEIEQFIVKGISKPKSQTQSYVDAYFIINAEGLSQEVTMQFFDQYSRFTLVTNPFIARVSYEE